MSTAKLYKIQCLKVPEYIYIGATTTKYLCERFSFYKTEYKRYLKSKLNYEEYKKYIAIKLEFNNQPIILLFKLFDKYDIKSFRIILLDELIHTSPDELKKQVYDYIQSNNCINKIV